MAHISSRMPAMPLRSSEPRTPCVTRLDRVEITSRVTGASMRAGRYGADAKGRAAAGAPGSNLTRSWST
ncbi:Uncharacterised protein [Bordetella pertussis]|nr:Uncharacterised protein [Bordetella pertussis]